MIWGSEMGAADGSVNGFGNPSRSGVIEVKGFGTKRPGLPSFGEGVWYS